MIFTPVLAVLAVAFQGPMSSAPARSPAAANQRSVRIALLHTSAKRAVAAVTAAHISGVKFVSGDVEDNVIEVRADDAGLWAVRDLIAKLDHNPLIVKRFAVLHLDAKQVHKSFAAKLPDGVDFLSYDPTENSIVARGTEAGLEKLGQRIAELDKITPSW